MVKQDFTKHLGTVVYDILFDRYGTIISVDEDIVYPVRVNFDSGAIGRYTKYGCLFVHCNNQSMFFEKPEFDIPPEPKKKITKYHVKYANLYRQGINANAPIHVSYFTSMTEAREDAAARTKYNEYLTIGHKIDIPYKDYV